MRKSGILMHISSLPSSYGIGKFGKSAYKFVDFLEQCKIGLWQILPLSPTSYGDSPYQSFSAFAGNPYFIDFEILEADGLLLKSDYLSIDWEKDPRKVDYEFLYDHVYETLRKAFAKFRPNQEYAVFELRTREWLDDYALFMALKFQNKGLPWYKWSKNLAFTKNEAIDKAKKSLSSEIKFHKFVQYCFYRQWKNLKNYANSKGIQIVGDIPIYVAYDSVEVWKTPELFCLDNNKYPIAVAGCPPDSFSPSGQLWGNPLYDWRFHQRSDYEWWIKRLRQATDIYDIVRIDHFRGFESYYSVPFGNQTAEMGIWQKGPDIELFAKAERALGKLNIIAEDLGFITPEVQRLLDRAGYPGMKVMQFAFSNPKNGYFPHNYTTTNCIAYTGTHDNDTLAGWYKTLDENTLNFCKAYLHVKNDSEIPYEMIRLAWSSIADSAIAQFQDFTGQGSEARMNIPSTTCNNWTYRACESDFTTELKEKILMLNILYNRCNRIIPKQERADINEQTEFIKGFRSAT
ncbi:MAG: 4-alpha-glucanotransferase [Oscillospiraceae bacterium]|nr:4-alpha-glucanotransferase [Oscillospiraceae bacterium]